MLIEDKIYNYNKNQAFIDLIPSNTKKILDLGCGTGLIADYLDKNIIIHGITLSEKEFEIAQLKLQKVFIFNLENGLPTNIDKDYDLILASHVLEHIAYPKKLLNDNKKVLIPEGNLIVALPNIMHYKYRFRLFSGCFTYEDAGVMNFTHIRRYTYRSAQKLLTDHGFHILKAYVSGELPAFRILKFLPKSFQKIIKAALFKISKGLFGMQLLYSASLKQYKPNSKIKYDANFKSY